MTSPSTKGEDVLLPCPFCGGEAEIKRRGDYSVSTIYSCTDCGCSLETGEQWNHGAAWNHRPPDVAVKALADGLKRSIEDAKFHAHELILSASDGSESYTDYRASKNLEESLGKIEYAALELARCPPDIEALREALEPFAEWAGTWPDPEDNLTVVCHLHGNHLYEARLGTKDFRRARQAIAGAGEVVMHPNPRAELIEALKSYEQADQDGIMVVVSRQACDEAAALLSGEMAENKNLRSALSAVQEKINEVDPFGDYFTAHDHADFFAMLSSSPTAGCP